MGLCRDSLIRSWIQLASRRVESRCTRAGESGRGWPGDGSKGVSQRMGRRLAVLDRCIEYVFAHERQHSCALHWSATLQVGSRTEQMLVYKGNTVPYRYSDGAEDDRQTQGMGFHSLAVDVDVGFRYRNSKWRKLAERLSVGAVLKR